MAEAGRFVAAKFLAPELATPQKPGLIVAVNNAPIKRNSRYNKPLKIVDREFTHGIAAHATSKIVVRLPGPGKKFLCQIGLDNNPQTASGNGTVVFSVNIAGHNVFRSDVMKVNMAAKPVEIDLGGATEFALEVGDAGDGIAWDQADWADARVELADGKTVLARRSAGHRRARGALLSRPALLVHLQRSSVRRVSGNVAGRSQVDEARQPSHGPHGRLPRSRRRAFAPLRGRRIRRLSHGGMDALFQNNAAAVTPIIENIQSLDVRWQRGPDKEYLLHHNIGAPADNTDYTPLESVLGGNSTKPSARLAGGRSTNTNMSYFNLERNKDDGLILAVGWPGHGFRFFMLRDPDNFHWVWDTGLLDQINRSPASFAAELENRITPRPVMISRRGASRIG